jgi:peptide/nickel transport system permease protein
LRAKIKQYLMLQFILRRLTWLIFVLLGLCVITFILSRVVPGDPAELYLGPRPKPEQVELVRTQLGFDKPLYIQFLYYLRDLSPS